VRWPITLSVNEFGMHVSKLTEMEVDNSDDRVARRIDLLSVEVWVQTTASIHEEVNLTAGATTRRSYSFLRGVIISLNTLKPTSAPHLFLRLMERRKIGVARINRVRNRALTPSYPCSVWRSVAHCHVFFVVVSLDSKPCSLTTQLCKGD
jgi:hypothetical protein